MQTERTDLVDTIRQLTQTMKLKDLIIANFIPDDIARAVEKRAAWNQEEDNWSLPVRRMKALLRGCGFN